MCRFSLPSLVLAVVLAVPSFAQADQHADLRALAKDLAAAIEANATKLHAEGIVGYAPGSREREGIGEIRKKFEELSHSTPTARQIDTAGYELSRLATDAPELYDSIVNESNMRARIQSAERDVGMQVFVPADLISHGMEILGKLLALAKTKPIIDQPEQKHEHKISNEDLDELAAELEKEAKASTIKANRHSAVQMGQVIYQWYGMLKSSGHRLSEQLDIQIMSYLLDSGGPAYSYYRLHAFYGNNNTSAIRLGNMYMAKYCHDATGFGFSCFTVMAQAALVHARLGQTASQATAMQSLDKTLGEHQRLRLVIAGSEKVSEANAEESKKSALRLRSYVPTMDDIMRGDREPWTSDEMESSMAVLMEAQARSYWIARAAGKSLSRVIAAMKNASPQKHMDDDWVAVLLSGSYLAAGELADHRTTLTAIRAIRTFYMEKAQGSELEFDQFDLLEIQALYSANEMQEARKLAKQMRKRALYREQQSHPKAVPFTVLASCQSAQDFQPDRIAKQGISLAEYALTKIEMKIALRMGESIPMAKLVSAIEYEAHGMFGSASESGIQPSEFASHWPEYSRILAADRTVQRRTAKAVKCLLARPDIVARLGMDFINKGGKERQILNASVFVILSDSGMFEKKSSTIVNEDFVLLQAASILQAQNGISAATAGSVFTDAEARNSVRKAELSFATISDKLANLGTGSGLNLSLAVQTMRGSGSRDFEQMFSVMVRHPHQFAKYAELRNQSIATLAKVKNSLGEGEATMLLTLFESKLITVIVKPDSALMSVADISRKDMKDTVAKLQASINFLSPDSKTLPPDYRVDIAWKLYRQLVKPTEASLSGVDTVYLVTGEDMAPIPFAALVSAPPPPQSAVDFYTYRQLKWLGDKYAFVSLPSVHALLKTAATADNKRSGRLLGIGDPAVSNQILIDLRLAPMPDTSSLLARVGKPIDPVPLLKERANYLNLLEASSSETLSGTDILLINSHALAAGESEKYGTREPAILLAPSPQKQGADFLDSPQVMSLKLSLRLIILLACETAGGRTNENAQPFAGLVNSFFFAGADSVLATNLPIDPAVAEEFAVNFLRHLRDDQRSSAKALQMAAADVRCANDSMGCAVGKKFVWAHPAYWSQFTLVGSGR